MLKRKMYSVLKKWKKDLQYEIECTIMARQSKRSQIKGKSMEKEMKKVKKEVDKAKKV